MPPPSQRPSSSGSPQLDEKQPPARFYASSTASLTAPRSSRSLPPVENTSTLRRPTRALPTPYGYLWSPPTSLTAEPDGTNSTTSPASGPAFDHQRRTQTPP